MRRGFLILTGLAPFMAMAEEEPRISEVMPAAGVPWINAHIADAEGDGDSDLFFVDAFLSVGNPGITNVWIENKGGRRFSNPRIMSYRHRSGPTMDQWEDPIDINGDGRLDLLVESHSRHTLGIAPVAVLVDTEGKAIRRERLVEPGNHIWKAIDLEGNRHMALVEITPSPSGPDSTVRIWKYSATGTLEPWTSQLFNLPNVPWNSSISARDVDDDGDLDVIFNLSDTTYVLERTGGTSFAETPHALEIASNSTWGDLDGDGDLDTCSIFNNEATWSINQGEFVFSEPQTQSLAPEEFLPSPQIIHIASVPGGPSIITIPRQAYDQDGLESTSIVRFKFGSWEKILDQEIGHTDSAASGGTDWAIIGLRDLDRDGFLDAVMRAQATWPGQTIYDKAPARIAVAWGTASSFTEPKWITGAPMRTEPPTPGDFDRDGDQDIVMGPDVEGHILLLKNDGKGNFGTTREIQELLPRWLAALGGRAYIINCADLDGNGIPDLVVNYQRDGKVPGSLDQGTATAFGLGNGTFSIPALRRVAAANNRNYFNLLFNAWRNDLRDLWTGTKKWNQISWSPPPSATQLRQLPIFSNTLGPAPVQIFEFIDMDGDQDLDAIEFGGWQENVRGELQAIHPMLGPATIPDLIGNPAIVGGFTAGDLDGDLRPDFVSMTYPESDPEADPYTTSIGIGYNNGRGEIASISRLNVSLLVMDLLGNPYSTFCRIADVNGDGLNDLLTLDKTAFDLLGNPILTSRWRRNPGGGSRDSNLWEVADLPMTIDRGFKWIDFNGDGVREWATSTGYMTPTSTGPQASETYDFSGGASLTIRSTPPAPYAIADFDGDGDADFLYVGNDPFYQPIPHLSLVRNTIIDERVPKQKPVFKWPFNAWLRR